LLLYILERMSLALSNTLIFLPPSLSGIHYFYYMTLHRNTKPFLSIDSTIITKKNTI
jgi:hypothetical protein